MNEHDSERIAGLLETDGYVRTSRADEAEVVVLNTCAVRENADNRLYGSLGHLKPLKERNPRMRIVVAGCLAQKDQGLIQRRAPWVDIVLGTHALPSLLELIHAAERDGPQMDVREFTEVFPSALPARRGSKHHAWVSVSVGCDNRCTFCIVPLVRGPQLSRPLGDVLAEVQGLARDGVVEVTLLGQNVNPYGSDLPVPGRRRPGSRSSSRSRWCRSGSIASWRCRNASRSSATRPWSASRWRCSSRARAARAGPRAGPAPTSSSTSTATGVRATSSTS